MKTSLEDRLWEQVRHYNQLSEHYKKVADDLVELLQSDSV